MTEKGLERRERDGQRFERFFFFEDILLQVAEHGLMKLLI